MKLRFAPLILAALVLAVFFGRVSDAAASKAVKPRTRSIAAGILQAHLMTVDVAGSQSWWGSPEDVAAMQATIEAVGALAKDPALFREGLGAFRARDSKRFQAALNRAGIVKSSAADLSVAALEALFNGPDDPDDPLATGEAIAQLAKDPALFNEALAAFRARDEERFHAALEKAGVANRCHIICHFFCQKEMLRICLLFCPEGQTTPIDAEEIRAFALALAQLVQDQDALQSLFKIIDAADVQGWRSALDRLKLTRFCYQLCQFLSGWRCKLICQQLCPPDPLITRVGSIPVSQIGPQGFGNGLSIPPIQVPAPVPAAGVGDHPFGAGATLMGLFNRPATTQYRVEVASNPGGPYTPIAIPVLGYNIDPITFLPVAATRFPSGGPDPGWYNVADIAVSDGGPTAIGEKRLLDWPTTTLPDGIYYLRLSVRNAPAAPIHFSSPQVVQTDNTPPPTPVIKLQLKKPDGSLVDLKCGKVKKGDGLILITVQAFDQNFSRLSVAAEGDTSLSVPIVDTSAVPLSKTYNGNLADKGYPAPTQFLWDPWSDPKIIPCCYIVRIDIWDRAVLNNSWSGGHGNSGWEAIEIGF